MEEMLRVFHQNFRVPDLNDTLPDPPLSSRQHVLTLYKAISARNRGYHDFGALLKTMAGIWIPDQYHDGLFGTYRRYGFRERADYSRSTLAQPVKDVRVREIDQYGITHRRRVKS